MPRSQYLLPLLLPWLAAAGPLPGNTNLVPTTDSTTHANHIFNAIHNSMRQFGSSLNHNGMSLFIATVPEGTELYHGTSNKDRVNGTQWLAFEPEHALIFARGRRGPPPGHPPGDGHAPPPGEEDDESDMPYHPEEFSSHSKPINEGNEEKNHSDSGYLHTYRTRHSLRLLYVDGQSAAKSSKGTLDTQDVLLLEDSIDHDSGMFGERERAAQLCKLAHERWNDRVDGILRMEGGFEIILCDFAAHLDVVSIAKTNPKAGGGFGGGGDNGDGFNYYRAIAARYHGIGGGRAVLDYEGFVSTFAYPEAMFFDDTGRPRLNNGSAAIDDLRRAVDKMILRKGDNIEAVDWQAIVDMVVARYADRIEYLASGSLKSLAALQSEIERALRPFIDYNARNSSSEIERCASQFMPNPVSRTSTNVAAQAIRQVTNTLCSSFLTASEQTEYTTALEQIKQLKEYLAWTTWKQCRGCAADEICFLPIWPVGTAEDFEQPKCRSDVSLGPGRGEGDRYWNDFGGPGRKGPGPHKRGKIDV
ncbi:uncharacterized protein M437DRAFT_58695 [Aureobasidium melanogenum CBS 110374]|uniref:Uncharacterized protein n=1 Tax=Aureobasidium melanogenum (strain CBS 110374) TaxID=1043003 RepID=A0A074VI46_AURM1|nr:uncharacterized protein M437DRAFT_58695 [Aureobasidium melanogenum CBS 110374]KEQ58724.1 hypothetical protein M437DRAFT_58695 [Aureobasidium melanogenum CBS 110374]